MAASVMGRRTLVFIRPMSATECLAALGSVLASGRSQVAVLSADWGEWGAMGWCPGSRWPSPRRRRRRDVPALPGIASKLESTPPSRRRSTLVEYLRIEVARILGLGDNHPIDEREPLTPSGSIPSWPWSSGTPWRWRSKRATRAHSPFRLSHPERTGR